VVSPDLGLKLETLTLGDLGRVEKVTVDKDATTLVGGGGTRKDIEAREKQLRLELEQTESEYDREKLGERLAKLAGGVAIIKVGAATETEMKERKARVEDALHATRAAVEEGIVPGGGVALLRTLPALEKLALPGDRQYGVNIVRRAIEEPLRQLARNAGVEGAVVVSKVRGGKGAFGYNVASDEYEDLLLAGVIDPTKVVRVALQNAASIASLMLTTEAVVAEHRAEGTPTPSADMAALMAGPARGT
jgi:chaperonin GroEL